MTGEIPTEKVLELCETIYTKVLKSIEEDFMTIPEEKARWVMSAESNKESAERYDAWAEQYDADLQSWGYRSPAIIAGIVGRYIPLDSSPILDAGAGTGIIGEVLNILGYKGIVALDLSKGMLDVAARKGVYSDLYQMALGKGMDFPTDYFAAVVCVGTFASGHAPPDSLDELIRITRPRGHIIFTVRSEVYERGGFKRKQQELQLANEWQLLEIVGPYISIPGSDDPEGTNKVFAYRVT
ncbi:MAG TPA: methyltransferase domain-containing protein [Dehalococcoidia bacterium]|nr:methyltransferase domain-containing protein [Dehalococcoidia bacterium]